MGRKSVAVLDVRSSEVTVLIGERGVNHTFVFKGNRSEPYDGYEEGAFYDVANFSAAVLRALTAVEQVCGDRIKTLYVGVPGEFIEVLPKEHEVSFANKRKMSQKDVQLLYEGGKEEREGYRCIRTSAMVYTTSDNRRVINPIGLYSEKLSGLLSYFYCREYFIQTIEEVLSGRGITLHFIPSEYAQAIYLIASETRDEYALYLDVGFLSSTVCVVLGNGVLAQQTFWVGRGLIVARLMQAFSLPYDGALALLSKANLYRKASSPNTEFFWKGESYDIPSDAFIEAVKAGLDDICEQVGCFLENCTGRELEYKPLYISGEGLLDIRGALEHMSKRFNRVCEEVSPDLPYYNKPSASSRIALVDMAYEDNRKSGFFYRLLNGFGG